MRYKDIYYAFQGMFPNIAEKTTQYFPIGKNGIRIRGSFGEMIFSYNGPNDWKLQTSK